MRPTKALIYTVIPVFRTEEHIRQVVEQASWYSDRVIVTRNVHVATPILTDYAHVRASGYEGADLRRDAHFNAWYESPSEIALMEMERPIRFVYLEASQVLSDPHIVRAAIEQNPDKTLTARRFFMWDDEHYRNDGYYYPQRLPVAGNSAMTVGWLDEQATCPAHFYTETDQHIEAPFDIQDLRFLDHTRRVPDGTPTLRKYEGRILV